MRDLSVVGFTRHDDDRTADRLDQGGVIGAVDLGLVRPSEHACTKALWSLHRHESCSIRRRDHLGNDCADSLHVSHFDHLHCVHHRQAGDRTIGTGFDSVNHRFEQRYGCERPSSVVDENDVGFVGHGLQAVSHARRAGRSAGNDDERNTRELVDERMSMCVLVVHIVGGNDDDDRVAALRRSVDRMIDHTAATERFELLHRPESPTRSAGNDDRPNTALPFRRRTTSLDNGHER